MKGGGVELLIVVLGDDEGALRPDCNHYEEGETEAITIGVMVVNSNRKGNLANSWEEKALKVRLEMLSMADGELKTNLQIEWD